MASVKNMPVLKFFQTHFHVIVTSKSLIYLLIFSYYMSLDKRSGQWILINFSLNISDKKGKEMKMTAITYDDC
jgi:hypothetical protein